MLYIFVSCEVSYLRLQVPVTEQFNLSALVSLHLTVGLSVSLQLLL